MRQSVEAYRAELAALSPQELLARYNEEKQREFDAAVAKAEQEERARFFNQPHAAANFAYWSKMAHWTLDEAVALSFGKAPEHVNWQAVSKHLPFSRFAGEYQRRRELTVRAVPWKQLYDPVLPTIFLAWAKRTEIDVPAALVEEVEKRGDQVADWKSLYDNVMEARKRDAETAAMERAERMGMLNELSARLEAERSGWDITLNEKDEQIGALKERVAALEQLQTNQTDPEIGTRARDSLLKLVIGMAVGAYAYDPKVGRSDRPTEIAGDLERAGVVLDVDTVRKWLREAAELLPPKQNE
jgi:hypothetical protein